MGVAHVAVGVALAGCGFELSAPGAGPADADADALTDSAVDAAVDAPPDVAIDAPPTTVSCLSGAWCRRMELTIPAGKVTGGPHAKFPLLVDFAADANLAMHARSDGADILFTAANGTTKLDHERVTFVKSNGRLLAWVEIPMLTAATKLFIYYGNAAATDQQNIDATWENPFKGVWHLEQTVGMQTDSSTFNNSGVPQNNLSLGVTGKVGLGIDFDGNDDRMQMADSASLDSMSAAATFELWINWDNAADGGAQLVMTSSNNFTAPKSSFEWATQADGDHFFYPRRGDGDDAYNLTAAPFINGRWHHIAVTLEHATKQALIYKDGALLTPTVMNVPSLWMTMAQPADWLWGGHSAYAGQFAGRMDEIRVSNVVRPASWLATEFTNQNEPASFVMRGPEVVLQ